MAVVPLLAAGWREMVQLSHHEHGRGGGETHPAREVSAEAGNIFSTPLEEPQQQNRHAAW